MKEIHRLYVEYKADLYHYLLGLTKDPNTADDLLSETFLKAILSLPSFRGDSTIKTWLFGIARNLWLQHLKKHRPTAEYGELADYTLQGELIQTIVTTELAQRIQELLLEMDARSRDVVTMRMNGHPYQLIACTLKVSESSARVIEFRARKWQRNVVEGGLSMKISCEVFRDLLPLVTDGVASKESEALVHEHMAQCDDCRSLFKGRNGGTPSAQEPRVSKLKAVLFAALATIVMLGCAIGYFMSSAATPMPVLLVIVSLLSLAVFGIMLFRGGLHMRRFFYGKAIGTVVLFALLGIYLLLRYVLRLF